MSQKSAHYELTGDLVDCIKAAFSCHTLLERHPGFEDYIQGIGKYRELFLSIVDSYILGTYTGQVPSGWDHQKAIKLRIWADVDWADIEQLENARDILVEESGYPEKP